MKPLSIDFRQKSISVYEKENVSIRELAKRFYVAKSFIQKLLKQYQQTGDIRPKPQGGNVPPKVQGDDLVTLTEIKENEEVQLKRVDFWKKIRDIKVEDLIFIDESGVNLAMVRLYARALKGKRARVVKPQKNGIVDAMAQVTQQDIRNWFTHCCYCTS